MATNSTNGTNRNFGLFAQRQRAVVSKATLRLIKGQARRAYGHTGMRKVNANA